MNTSALSKQRGFTLSELIVVVSMMSVLLVLSTFNLTGAKSKTDINTSVTTFISDFKQQQQKAMIGDTEGRDIPDVYGIHFNTTSYTLFHGSTYSSSDTANFVIQLGDSVEVSAPSDVIFSRVSGEVSGFQPSTNTITLKNVASNDVKIIQFNKYGVITSVN